MLSAPPFAMNELPHLDLSQLDRPDLDRLAAQCKTEDEKERIADQLLRMAEGWRSGAHSETSRTRRNAAWRNLNSSFDELQESGYDPEAACPDLTDTIIHAIAQGLSKRHALMWGLFSTGCPQAIIARHFKITQGAVSRQIERLKHKVLAAASSDITYIYYSETHKSRPHQISNREPLPAAVERAREVIEAAGYHTWWFSHWPRSIVVVRNPQELFDKNDWLHLPRIRFPKLINIAADLESGKAVDFNQLLDQ